MIERQSTESGSMLHRLNPSLKLAGLVIITTGILIYPSWQFSGLLLLLTILGFKASNVPLNVSKKRIRFLVAFSALLLAFQVLITANGTILFFIIPQYDILGPFLPVTDFGIEKGFEISLRFLLVVFSSMLFVSVTDPTLLAHSLTRLGVPYRYSFALVIALRFLPLFDMENKTVRMAQRSRGISVSVRGMSKILRTIRYTFFPLLVSALSRVDALSLSMDGRGFGHSRTRTYLRKSSWTALDSSVLVLLSVLLLASILLALGFLPQISAII
jgi:energy-coupling factor transport system permease protein